MSAFALYLLTESQTNFYLLTEDFGKKHAYLFTENFKGAYVISEDFKKKAAYLFSNSFKSTYVISEDFKKRAAYFLVSAYISNYIITEEFEELNYPQFCDYPTFLEKLRDKATVLYNNEIDAVLKKSLSDESWGKISMGGYNRAGMMRILIDYLSSIWIEKDTDSRSGLARTSDYYYTKYFINDIIINFRACGINIKPIVALFNLNSYTVIDGQWPNYFMQNAVINPPQPGSGQMKQYKDIYTTQGDIDVDNYQSIYSLSDAQINFTPTKNIKYFSSFTVNGVDYSGYVDYNSNSVTYSPSVAFGYTIQRNDIVTITYWYEE
jgi:hypothetical protein